MKTFCFDIDGTICTITDGKYDEAEPYPTRIEQLNKLHQEGNKVILFTARGTSTGIDWKNTTTKQLNKWGVKYDELIFGKPEADFFVDDKATDLFNWFD
tara:strand:+ start:267 stop:563 length:297 start_codon:yes stop_codon:yes gene_type:complete